MLVGVFGLLALTGGLVWAFVRWFLRAPLQPDPWDASVAIELETTQPAPLCHRCLLPHDPASDFCPSCGTAVGTYTNWLPYPYLFSIGHALRVGTAGEFKRTRLAVFGYLLFSLAEYALFAPVYWVVFLRHLLSPPATAPPLDPESTTPPFGPPGAT
jgi:hypothetical protein